ncbi:MAG: bifunctional proline dehydrogenase/L-glutamate gamma-semialdehyde dehydrogenase PutA [Rhodospirillales bacterium]|nr:bifunctional proline dehydrogenase/L-glutamate gamma-semialdehyde dehydrogenase PutA [Rhodospirillales bacterium]
MNFVFARPPEEVGARRAAIRAHQRGDETASVQALLDRLDQPDDAGTRIQARAHHLVEAVRRERRGRGGLDAFLHEYGLSSQEGVLLMCIAEALLRVPDDLTQERLIRDKMSAADWDRHLGRSSSLFVNASTWALMLTGRMVRLHDAAGQTPGAAMGRLIARLGEPVVREAVNQAMRILGRQFVMGRTIENALDRAKPLEKRGYRYSYDMLGEAARTMADAERYFRSYANAIAAIGAAAKDRDVISGPGISVKLSALHPRYEVAQADRVMAEVVPRLRELARAAAAAEIALTIDAEEADRLDLSLDVIAALAGERSLAGWGGLGVVVQTYQKNAPHVIEWLAETARKARRRLMVRLVKGAYWDAEIKRAQELGLPGYPVFTRKALTDVSYLACARMLLAERDAFYPQFATHNAHSIAAVLEYAGGRRDYEFQRLHGMADGLYEQLIEKDGVGVGCRIYAPVGQHEDLLAYLVRRLLENGANSSFVNRIQDDRLPVDEIVADPIARVRSLAHVPHPRIPEPRAMFLPERLNSAGIDLADRSRLAVLAENMAAAGRGPWTAAPLIGGGEIGEGGAGGRAVASPSDAARTVGSVTEATADDVARALQIAAAAAPQWAETPVDERAACLDRAADRLEREMPALMAMCIAEAGKTVADAVAEVREAVDFCRYYAARARADLERPLPLPVGGDGVRAVTLGGGGLFACISPWNFPLAIFTGQVTAALVAGNAVLAKPAEQTPLIAAQAVRILLAAGIPGDVLHLLPGDGARVGAPLVADPRISGVAFTGSTEVAWQINRTLARRDGPPATLIAETGGQNAMIVDSTALPEQVTRDALVSAFQSAGQRCSALRVLFVQEDIADGLLRMLAGAMDELVIDDPALLATDIGPVIDADARDMLNGHVTRMEREARILARARLGPNTSRGTFFAPTLVEIDRLSRLQREVFGPVLHVIRYRADRLDDVLAAINDTGYGLTLGVQTRIDQTWRRIFGRTRVGNTYVNRNQIGAMVGVQPFGGQGLSGTGPKAGGPMYLRRFSTYRPAREGVATPSEARSASGRGPTPIVRFARAGLAAAMRTAGEGGRAWAAMAAEVRADRLERAADRLLATNAAGEEAARYVRFYGAQLRAEFAEPDALPGPTGERNEIRHAPRGVVICLSLGDGLDLVPFVAQIAAALAAGNGVVAWHANPTLAAEAVAAVIGGGVLEDALVLLPVGDDGSVEDLAAAPELAGLAYAGPDALVPVLNRALAARDGPIIPLILFAEEPNGDLGRGMSPAGCAHYLGGFMHERTLCVDTTASGGNASLLSLGEEP